MHSISKFHAGKFFIVSKFYVAGTLLFYWGPGRSFKEDMCSFKSIREKNKGYGESILCIKSVNICSLFCLLTNPDINRIN